MATIDTHSVALNIFVSGGAKPTVTPATVGSRIGFGFNSPRIDANASMTLTGAAGENVGGWTLGFIQLKYIGTHRAHYRGATVRDGSMMFTGSNKTLCRDTDDGSTEVWYDSINFGGVTGPTGTNKLAAATVLPQIGILNIRAHLSDQPYRWVPATLTNTLVSGRPNNYLHYAVIELLFCTMLVAQDPAGAFHMLKHFYWNVIWEQKFKRDAVTGNVAVDQAIRLQHNVQHGARNGNPRDPNFFGREYDLTLPISNIVSQTSPPRFAYALDWSRG